jgi:hypothetical protein
MRMSQRTEHNPTAAAADARREKLDALQQRLTDQVADLRSGADWQRMLKFASRFHRYSANNSMLIAQQYTAMFEQGIVDKPVPSYVAGFNTWRALGRAVDRGQKGLAILAPTVYRDRGVAEPDGTMRELHAGERATKGETVVRGGRQVRGFRVEHVFALEQTSGEPLPSVPRPQPLVGQAPDGLIDGLRDLAVQEGFTLSMVASKDDLDGADGTTRFTDRSIRVRSDMSEAAIASTLAHELGHVLLHDPHRDDGPTVTHRGIGEVEAESVAYIVSAAHGLDTSCDSMPYVAGWLGSRGDIRDVQATANRVVAAAHHVLSSLPTIQNGDGQPPGVSAAIAKRQAGKRPDRVPVDASASRAAAPELR